MEPVGVSVAIAFAAGLLSFISPCQLAVVPGYVGYLSGAVANSTGGTATRGRTIGHALAFILGFTAVFVALGASVGLFGYLLQDYLPIVRRVGGVIVVLLGLHLAGILPLPFLYRELRLEQPTSTRRGYLPSLFLGFFFGVGWTPCIGPTLAAILLLAGTTQTVGHGAGLLLVYSLGLGVPFLATALALGSASRLIRRLNRHGNVVSVVSGILLIIMGVLLFTDQLARLPALLGGWTPLGL